MIRRLLAVPLVLFAAPAVAADEAAIDEVRAAWSACTEHLASGTDDWIGWRRVYDGGYADIFEFWDGSYDGVQPSILKRRYLIDAIASEEQTYCFRADGSLAFVLTEMTSPNMAGGTEGPAITRQGRIYVDPAGGILRVLGGIVAEGVETGLTDERYQLARGCWELDLHLTVDAVRANYLSEMGDIDGTHPDYTPNPYDWCSAAE